MLMNKEKEERNKRDGENLRVVREKFKNEF